MRTALVFGSLVVIVAACADSIGAPDPLPSLAPSRSLTSAATGHCGTPTVTVTDEAGLLSALGNAASGTVIGLNGTISISAPVYITTDSVTLTCASPGSGVFAGATLTFDDLFYVQASGVTVRGLVLDASAAVGPMAAFPSEEGPPVSAFHFSHNVVTCGSDECLFLSSTPAAVIADNTFTASAIVTGLHIQAPAVDGTIDGTRVERNTIIATAPSTVDRFGAIRVLGGNGILISDNDVRGPWQNGIALSRVGQSTIAGNHIDSALGYGVAATVAFSGPTGVDYVVIRDNQIHRSGIAGIFLRDACFNSIFDNNLLGNAGNIGLIFSDPGTGGNSFVGSGTIVVDNGGFDCDQDGVLDPNRIIGATSIAQRVSVPPSSRSAVFSNRLH